MKVALDKAKHLYLDHIDQQQVVSAGMADLSRPLTAAMGI